MREKLDMLVKFNEILDVSNWVVGPQPRSELRYKLFAVSNHIGFGIGGGHYTAYALHNGKWNLFNDSGVSSTTSDRYVLLANSANSKRDYRSIDPFGNRTGCAPTKHMCSFTIASRKMS